MNRSSKEVSNRSKAVLSKKEKEMGIFGMHIGSPFFYLLFVILQLLQQHCNAVAGDILVAPENQRIAINTGPAEFYCKAMGQNTRWVVKKDTFATNNRTEGELQFVEFIEKDAEGGFENTHDLYLYIPSTLTWNNTEIRCAAYRDVPIFSPAATLTIMGGPATPDPSIRTVSSSLLILEWDKPFTWTEHPIEQYSLTSNHSLYFPTQTLLKNVTMSRQSVQVERKEGTGECEVIEFSVKANNGLADSEARTVTAGFPIAPVTSDVSIEESITFYEDLSPLISLSIQLPRVCWFQEIEYVVTLTRMDLENGEEVATTSAQRQRYWEGQTVTVSFSDNLVSDATYSATVVFKTFAEDDSTITAPVEASKTFYTTVNTPVVTQGGIGSSPLTVDNMIIIGIVGGVVILCLLVFIFIAVVACFSMQRRRTPSTTSNIQNRPLPMVTNPIYEGNPVYETVDHHFNSLSSSSLERPRTPTTPTSIAPLLIESPYAVTTIDPKYTAHKHPSTEQDNYTIMFSAGADKTETRQESNLDQDVRYAPEPGSVVVTSSDW